MNNMLATIQDARICLIWLRLLVDTEIDKIEITKVIDKLDEIRHQIEVDSKNIHDLK